MPQTNYKGYRQGRDLLLGLMKNDKFVPLGYSTGCKISDKTETGERVTKEQPDNPGQVQHAMWKEKYVKGLSETITAEGFVYDESLAAENGFPKLKGIFLAALPVTLRYKYREADEGRDNYYEGQFILTSLEHDGPADDDEKWSVTFENNGPVCEITETSESAEWYRE
jgi:predicted secreted protein